MRGEKELDVKIRGRRVSECPERVSDATAKHAHHGPTTLGPRELLQHLLHVSCIFELFERGARFV